jgi:hypothetical protein
MSAREALATAFALAPMDTPRIRRPWPVALLIGVGYLAGHRIRRTLGPRGE